MERNIQIFFLFFCFVFFFFFKKLVYLFNWRLITLQYCSFCHTLTWIPGMAESGGLPSMGLHRVGHDWSDLAAAADMNQPWVHMCPPFWIPLPPPSPPHPSGLSQFTGFKCPVSCIELHVFQCYSLRSSHPLLPQSSKVLFISVPLLLSNI